jgi:hypothetical protein
MSWIRRNFGMGGIDLLLHVGVTIGLMVLAHQATNSGNGPTIVMTLSMLVLAYRRHAALQSMPPETTGEVAAQQFAEVEARLLEVEQLHFRVQELEERVDFAERLLAQTREPERLS